MPAPPKKLFMFNSESNAELHAFTDVGSGDKLPANHGPWAVAGVIDANKRPPHGLARAAIESGIAANGFQLWRKKKKEAVSE